MLKQHHQQLAPGVEDAPSVVQDTSCSSSASAGGHEAMADEGRTATSCTGDAAPVRDPVPDDFQRQERAVPATTAASTVATDAHNGMRDHDMTPTDKAIGLSSSGEPSARVQDNSRLEEGILVASPRFNGAVHGTAPEDVRHERQGPAAEIAAPQLRATLYDRVEEGRTRLVELNQAVAAADGLYCGFLDLAEDQPELAWDQLTLWTASFRELHRQRLRRDAHWKRLIDLESELCQADHDSDVFLVSRGLPSTAGAAPGGVWTLSEKELAAAHPPRGVRLGGPPEGPASSACAASRPPESSPVAGSPATPSIAS